MNPRTRAIIVAVVVPLIALTAVVVARRDGATHQPAPLPIAAGIRGATPSTFADAAQPAIAPYGGIVYKAASGLASLSGSAPAYKIAGGSDGTKLAEALGLPAAPDANGTYTDGDAQLTVSTSGAWGYTRNSSGTVSSGTAVACAPDADCPAPDTTVPQHPADLPTQDDAKNAALALLERAGIDTSSASVTVDDAVTQWVVSFVPAIDGVEIEGITTSVSIGGGGVVEYANGYLGRPERVDDYPLLGTAAAIARLNNGEGFVGIQPMTAEAANSYASTSSASDTPCSEMGPPTTPACPPFATTSPCTDSVSPTTPPCPTDTVTPEPPVTGTIPPPQPQEITITGVDQVLLLAPSYDGRDTYLVPGYRFHVDQGIGPSVIAIDDRFLAPPDQVPGTKVPATEVPPGPNVIEPASGGAATGG